MLSKPSDIIDDKSIIKYSTSNNYWYNIDTGVVYDYELHFAIGKIYIDNDGIPIKLNKDTYIIDKVIPIPMIDEVK